MPYRSRKGPPDFSQLLNPKLRWPTAGDRLFVSGDRATDADLSATPHNRRWLITEGYKRAADYMVERAEDGTVERDTLVYPIVFCYRHFIEMALKSLIASYGPGVRITPNWNTHDLMTLWRSFEAIRFEYDLVDHDGADAVVGDLVAEFAKIDPGSFSFRYPVDTAGKPLLLGRDSLDLVRLCDVMDGVAGYFDGTDGYLSELVSSGP